MKENPTIDELKNSGKYELTAKLNHSQVKEFVVEQLKSDNKLIRSFMIYQLIMSFVGLFFITRPVVLAIRGNLYPLFYMVAAAIFSFSLLVVIHEFLHGVALKLTGAKKIAFGGYVQDFIFYAEADKHVLNRRQFRFVALAPFYIVKILTVLGIIFYFNHPVLYFFIFIMSIHSFFCGGDIGMLSVFYKYPGSEVYTYDVREEKTSYYYKEII